MKALNIGRGIVTALTYAPNGKTLVTLNSNSRIRCGLAWTGAFGPFTGWRSHPTA